MHPNKVILIQLYILEKSIHYNVRDVQMVMYIQSLAVSRSERKCWSYVWLTTSSACVRIVTLPLLQQCVLLPLFKLVLFIHVAYSPQIKTSHILLVTIILSSSCFKAIWTF